MTWPFVPVVPKNGWSSTPDPRVHPLVHVALDRDHHLGGREGPGEAHALQRLAHVERLVDRGLRADVVEQRVAVANRERLAHAHADHARGVAALLLIEDDRLGGNGEREVAEAVLHVDEHVLECLTLADNDRLRGPLRRAVGRDALGVGVEPHHLGFRRRAVEHHRSGDGAGRGRIDRGRRRRRGSGRSRRPAAARHGRGDEEDRQKVCGQAHPFIISPA